MKELYKYRVSLTIIACLVILNFVVVPVLSWQESKGEALLLAQKKLNKAKSVIENKEYINATSEQLQVVADDVERLLYKVENIEDFKLEEQTRWQSLAESQELRIKRFGWKTPFIEPISGLGRLDLELQIEGDGDKIVDYLLDIKAKDKLAIDSEFRLSFRGQREQQLGIFNVYLNRKFYFDPNSAGFQE
ncbi:hypothetical protein CKO50_02905 [Pseudoalteromonas sp. HM-SA03]|uniref:hypothetical protein n=1 Tax=Pseudoalteromonas sp. HM-SA03 TaxID=2029678 RepID=UPI000BAE5479|nr:hypothetical protein [Pseudoalteromonas sp. HM-SA03]PAY02792.1 hypothetical protein CKO50_02905 [Pseudoalteromonas sp. HM-SA03]